mgnify:CR=1 FL=1
MGPRFFNRGNWDRRRNSGLEVPSFNGAAVFQPRKRDPDAIRRDVQLASMGPRFFNRGNDPLGVRQSPNLSLQWGRGFSTAETPVSNEMLFPGLLLQWGRGFSTAETASF